MVLRTRSNLPQATIERSAAVLEHMTSLHSLRIILRQHAQNPERVVVTCSSEATMERTLASLKQEGYTEGPPITSEFRLREGMILLLNI